MSRHTLVLDVRSPSTRRSRNRFTVLTDDGAIGHVSRDRQELWAFARLGLAQDPAEQYSQGFESADEAARAMLDSIARSPTRQEAAAPPPRYATEGRP